MELRDMGSSRFVSLEIVDYQFDANQQDQHDRNWLIVAGHAKSNDLEWKFRDPCLTTWEASALGAWIHAVSQGIAPVDRFVEDDDEIGALSFIEPNLRFGLVESNHLSATIRVYLQLESSPPDVYTGDFPDRWGYHIETTMTRADIATAATEWTDALQNFPQR